MATKFEPTIFIKLTKDGIADTVLENGLPGETESSALLLSMLSYELNILNRAAIAAWKKIQEESDK